MHTLIAADQVVPAALHAAFTAAFADYMAGPFALNLADWPAFLARQGVSLTLSRVAVDGHDAPVAFAFVAERPAPQRWRLATMGALPAARGRGAAPALLRDVVDRALVAGQRGVELEVFAQNARAVRLYEQHGFTPRVALHGHDAAPAGGPSVPPPEPVGREHALNWLAAAEAHLPDLPLQMGARLLATSAGWHAWRHGSAQLIFDDSTDGTLRIRSLVDTDPHQVDAQRLAEALRRAWPAHRVTMPPLLPLALGGNALQRAGFQRQTLHQWWMLRPLP